MEVTMPRSVLSTLGAVALAIPLVTAPAAASTAGVASGRSAAAAVTPPRQAEATGSGGAVSSVDPDATAIGIEVLRRGGNAADAAIATAAALGVSEPFSSGIGGGGFLVYYDARKHRVSTIDSRETAPASFTPTVFTEDRKSVV